MKQEQEGDHMNTKLPEGWTHYENTVSGVSDGKDVMITVRGGQVDILIDDDGRWAAQASIPAGVLLYVAEMLVG